MYPFMLRDILMWLAISEPKLFRAKWSETIHHEWMTALKRDHPTVNVAHIRNRMDQAVDDCLVEGYEPLIEGLSLPDPGDRHVLAAAIVCNADVIVTDNLKDFPLEALEEYGIEAQSPDEFVRNLLDLSPASVVSACNDARINLKKPPFTEEEYLVRLEELGLKETVRALRALGK